ncbi:hypothetical protein [Acuticoccus sp. I52.16.1]|uniref:hypothetical protein n=1 Tax=Acuticoccus sp. I52.16.1 TaxID=2928472 RepID=UPI001FD08A84|nr:hypothetical protein [Acuticoccus sp. I52.16.1]UOM34926.1 hypothetical protein MRB58_01565 [Acuticoccus sp. I52.16.1]
MQLLMALLISARKAADELGYVEMAGDLGDFAEGLVDDEPAAALGEVSATMTWVN